MKYAPSSAGPNHAFLISILLFAWPAGAWQQRQPGAPATPQSMELRIEGDKVTADIRITPAQTVLEELAARTGVIFEVATHWNPPISVVLYGSPLKDAIERCAGGADSIFYFGRDAEGRSRITVVRIFPRGMKGQPASLRRIGTGTATKTGYDTIETVEHAVAALAENAELEMRQKAVEVLAASKGPAAAQALLLAIDNKAVEVRVAAIEALAGMTERAALPRILGALKDSHPGVRQAAVEAVALLGAAENVKDIKPLTRDRDPGVAAAADLAVRRLSGRR